MPSSLAFVRRLAQLAAAALLSSASVAGAQEAPAAPTPAFTPSVKIGATIFLDYLFQQTPKVPDADGNDIRVNAFNVGRTYLNVTGNVTRRIAFRVTPDIARETGSGSAIDGSYSFRLKYAFAEYKLDDWMPRGSWLRFGLQQTPYLDFMEHIYRYRFQGTMSAERPHLITSSDAGVSFHYAFPESYGDLHVGVYNGDGYSHFEANNRKSVQIRGSVRPLAHHPVLKGLQLTGFYIGDSYIEDGTRRRGIVAATFEHAHATAGIEYFTAADQKSAAGPQIDGDGYSVWLVPRTSAGWEGLLRFDHYTPNQSVGGTQDTAIAGVAYWFPSTGGPSAAVMFDYEQTSFDGFATSLPTIKKFYVHTLVNF